MSEYIGRNFIRLNMMYFVIQQIQLLMRRLLLILSLVFLSCGEDKPTPQPIPEPTPTYTVSITAGDGGSVNTAGGTFEKGKTLEVLATPDAEYLFDKWSDDNTENPRTLTINSNISLSASFVKKKYALAITIEGEGTVEEEILVQGSTTDYNSGTKLRLTATASTGWSFTGWSGEIESTDNPIEVEIDEPISLTVTFTENQLQKDLLLGQWDYDYTTARIPNVSYTTEGESSYCSIDSLIFNQDDTFKLYTNDENGVPNYVIFGTYVVGETSVELFVKENDELISIGTIDDLTIVDGVVSGDYNIDNICIQLKDGFEESSYSDGLIYIPDPNLENWLVEEGWDDVIDGYMSKTVAENQPIIAIYAEDSGYDEDGNFCECYGDDRFSNRLTSLAGVEDFPNLQILNLTGNAVDSINISQNLEIKRLYLNFNSLKKLDTSNNEKLLEVSIDNNEDVLEVDFSQNLEIENISVPNIGLTSLDVSNNTNLTFLSIGGNNIESIDVSGLNALVHFKANFNKLQTIDFTDNTLLETISIDGNEISGTIDVSMCTNLVELGVLGNTGLEKIIVSQEQLDIYNDPSRQPQGYRWAVTGIELEVASSDGHHSGGGSSGGGAGSTGN